MWTLYVFLSHVTRGGAFRLPLLNLSVAAKPGRALLWPHLHDGAPASAAPSPRRAARTALAPSLP